MEVMYKIYMPCFVLVMAQLVGVCYKAINCAYLYENVLLLPVGNV
uniref:Uncharacterized protein n=1 Tax=Arundo donax TaxID=35708 RepID=A0A0A9FB90_ARUDO